MTNQPSSNQTLSDLTLSDLEKLIETIARRTIKQEMIAVKQDKYQSLLATFAGWEDDKTDEEIIQHIYDNRNSKVE